jgi:TRAP-type C4-dicarboxylate transport system permease small subunit
MGRLTGFAAVALFAALTGVVSLQVVNRMVLHLPIIWSEEAARFLFFWVVLLGAAMSVRRRRHFVLDVLGPGPGSSHGAFRRMLDLVPTVATLGFAVFLLIQSIVYVRAGLFRTATNSGVNMGLVYAAIPVFAALTIWYSLLNLREDVRASQRGRHADHGHPPAE